jgi:small subunit ribosomal protein S1
MSDSTEDFATLFEASTKAKRFERGQIIDGRIVGIGKEVAFLDVGGKGEATIDLDELKDADGKIAVKVGDRIQAMVTSTSGGLTLSHKLARGAATDRQIEDAYRSGLPVEGKVDRAVKGGYEVRIGQRRAFCPASQIDIARESSGHEGRVYEFRIIEYKDGGRTIVLSRRALLEEQQRVDAVKVREGIVPGDVVTGRVAAVRDFGAFVDLGAGVQGLLHVSEMAWSRVNDPSQIVKPGDEITVRVLRVDQDKQRISLGLKQLTEDPGTKVSDTDAVGQKPDGEATDVGEYQNEAPEGGLGSLADKLRDALKR